MPRLEQRHTDLGSRRIARTRQPPPAIRTPPMRQKAGPRHAWVITTTASVDNDSCIVVGVQATGARLSEESRSARDMITRFAQRQGRKPQSIAADASYGNGEFLQWLMDREITPYMPTRDAVGRTRSLLYGPECFTYLPESNSYICPGGQQLNYGGRNERNRTFGYIGTRKKCVPCQQKGPTNDWTVPISCDPHERDRSAAGTRSPDYTGVQVRTTATEEGRGALRRAKES